MSYLDTTKRIPKFGGIVYYVTTDGNDSNSGLTPLQPLLTIGAAIGKLSEGDAISVKAGTYTETGLDLDTNNCEIWFEIGTVIDPSSGTCLTISGNNCLIRPSNVGYKESALRITPAANETGLLVSGNFCYINGVRVACSSTADIGFDVTGNGCVLNGCRCSNPLIAAFKVQGDKVKIDDSCIGGTPADTSIGFWITNTCDKTRIKNCGSQGNGTAGFQIDLGCTNAIICNCSSGGGDGKFINNAVLTNCIISDFHFQGDNGSYNSPVYKQITFTAAGGQGGTGTHYRCFKINGCVRIIDLGFYVVTVLANTSTVPNFELTSSNATVDITDAAGGQDIDRACVGAVALRNAESTEPLDFGNPDATPAIMENTEKFSTKNIIDCIADDESDTYITLRLTNALASGAIIVSCRYLPLIPTGFVEPA